MRHVSIPTQRIRLCRITSWLFLAFRVSDVGLQVGGIVLCWTFCLGAAASLCNDQFALVLCSSNIINIYLSLKEGETGNVSASMRWCSSRWTRFYISFSIRVGFRIPRVSCELCFVAVGLYADDWHPTVERKERLILWPRRCSDCKGVGSISFVLQRSYWQKLSN